MSLKIDNLSKSFGKKDIFKNFSYEFSSTGIYLITGDSGVGKTTLLRIISGLDKTFTGQISNGGISNVSCVFQEYRLFPHLTAVENVMTAVNDEDESTLQKAKALLSELAFSDEDMKLFPSELSGGMKQRVSLARALFLPSLKIASTSLSAEASFSVYSAFIFMASAISLPAVSISSLILS